MLFRGEYWFLSNFYPISIEFEGDVYPTVENAFQAAKTLNKSERTIFKTCSPNLAKKIGRQVTLRPDWEQVKVNIMKELLRIKFANPLLKSKLLELNGPIVEENFWGDTFWGMCNGTGQNVLGQLLTNLKEELR